MEVIKRNGAKEEVSFDKIKNRITKMSNLTPQLKHVDAIEISQKVIARIYDNIRTVELDEETVLISNLPREIAVVPKPTVDSYLALLSLPAG